MSTSTRWPAVVSTAASPSVRKRTSERRKPVRITVLAPATMISHSPPAASVAIQSTLTPPAKRRRLVTFGSASVEAGRRERLASRRDRLVGAERTGVGLHAGDLGVGSFASRLHVRLVGVVAEVVPTRPHGGDRGGAGPHERIEHDVALVGVELDQPLGQLDGERRRVADARRALGGELPHVEGGVHELVGRGGGHRRQPLLQPHGPLSRSVEAALAGDHHALGEVAQHRVGRALERAPRAVRSRAVAPCARSPRRGGGARAGPAGCRRHRPRATGRACGRGWRR